MNFKNVKDGTYNRKMQIQHLKTGYQVSINRPELSKKDVNKVLKHVGTSWGERYIGVYHGAPEWSFNIQDKDKAMHIARAANQESIWDNKANKEIPNPHHNKNRKINADYIIKVLNDGKN